MSSIINEEKDPGCKAPKETSCTSEDTHAWPPEDRESPKKHQEDPAEDESESEGNDLISKEDSVKEGLSDDDKVVILTVFREQIDKGQQLTLKEIRDNES